MKIIRSILKTFIFLLCCIITVCALFLFRFPIAKYFGSFLEIRDPLKKCDVIFAPSSEISINFAYAADLLKNGIGESLIITTTKRPFLEAHFYQKYDLNCSERSIAERVFRKEGLPINKLTVLKDSTSSFTDCQLLLDYMRIRPFNSLILVTNSIHSRRFNMILKRVFKDTGIEIVSCPAFPDLQLDAFFTEKDDYVMYVFNEYIKLLAYRFKYMLCTFPKINKNKVLETISYLHAPS